MDTIVDPQCVMDKYPYLNNVTECGKTSWTWCELILAVFMEDGGARTKAGGWNLCSSYIALVCGVSELTYCRKSAGCRICTKFRCMCVDQGYPNYGPQAKSGPRNHFSQQQRHFVNENIIILTNICWFGKCSTNSLNIQFRDTTSILCNNAIVQIG